MGPRSGCDDKQLSEGENEDEDDEKEFENLDVAIRGGGLPNANRHTEGVQTIMRKEKEKEKKKRKRPRCRCTKGGKIYPVPKENYQQLVNAMQSPMDKGGSPGVAGSVHDLRRRTCRVPVVLDGKVPL